MSLNHLLSRHLFNELFQHNIISSDGLIIPNEQAVRRYGSYLRKQSMDRTTIKYLQRKVLVNKIQVLLKESSGPETKKELKTTLIKLGLQISENGVIDVKETNESPKSYLGPSYPTRSVWERQAEALVKSQKVEKKNIKFLDYWLQKISFNIPTQKFASKTAEEWKQEELKFRKRNQNVLKRMAEARQRWVSKPVEEQKEDIRLRWIFLLKRVIDNLEKFKLPGTTKRRRKSASGELSRDVTHFASSGDPLTDSHDPKGVGSRYLLRKLKSKPSFTKKNVSKVQTGHLEQEIATSMKQDILKDENTKSVEENGCGFAEKTHLENAGIREGGTPILIQQQKESQEESYTIKRKKVSSNKMDEKMLTRFSTHMEHKDAKNDGICTLTSTTESEDSLKRVKDNMTSLAADSEADGSTKSTDLSNSAQSTAEVGESTKSFDITSLSENDSEVDRRTESVYLSCPDQSTTKAVESSKLVNNSTPFSSMNNSVNEKSEHNDSKKDLTIDKGDALTAQTEAKDLDDSAPEKSLSRDKDTESKKSVDKNQLFQKHFNNKTQKSVSSFDDISLPTDRNKGCNKSKKPTKESTLSLNNVQNTKVSNNAVAERVFPKEEIATDVTRKAMHKNLSFLKQSSNATKEPVISAGGRSALTEENKEYGESNNKLINEDEFLSKQVENKSQDTVDDRSFAIEKIKSEVADNQFNPDTLESVNFADGKAVPIDQNNKCYNYNKKISSEKSLIPKQVEKDTTEPHDPVDGKCFPTEESIKSDEPYELINDDASLSKKLENDANDPVNNRYFSTEESNEIEESRKLISEDASLLSQLDNNENDWYDSVDGRSLDLRIESDSVEKPIHESISFDKLLNENTHKSYISIDDTTVPIEDNNESYESQKLSEDARKIENDEHGSKDLVDNESFSTEGDIKFDGFDKTIDVSLLKPTEHAVKRYVKKESICPQEDTNSQNPIDERMPQLTYVSSEAKKSIINAPSLEEYIEKPEIILEKSIALPRRLLNESEKDKNVDNKSNSSMDSLSGMSIDTSKRSVSFKPKKSKQNLFKNGNGGRLAFYKINKSVVSNEAHRIASARPLETKANASNISRSNSTAFNRSPSRNNLRISKIRINMHRKSNSKESKNK